MLSCKGAAGRKPCFKCSTIVSKACWDKLEGQTQSFQPLHHPSLTGVTQSTDNNIWAALAHLIHLKDQVTKKDHQEYEKNVGWHGTPEAAQSDPYVRQHVPPSKHSYDPLHCYFSAGILGIEMALLKDKVTDVIDWSFVQRQVKELSLRYKGYHRPNLVALQDNYFSDHQWKANASSQNGLWPLVHVVLAKLLPAYEKKELKPFLGSFFALCEELKHITILKHSAAKQGLDVLRKIQASYQKAFHACYGSDVFRPKHHYRLHLPDIMLQHGFLYDCITMERKHRLAKQEIQGRNSYLRGLDTSLLPRLHVVQLEELERYKMEARILSTKEACIGSLQLKVPVPVLFLAENVLFLANSWQTVSHGSLQGTGDIFQVKEMQTANLTLWCRSQCQITRSIAGCWLLPTYWCICNASIVETIL